MTIEEFVKQRCEIDKITEEEFEKTYRVVGCNCGAPYCKGYRCLDLDDLLKENQELKKQLEDKEDFIKKLQGTKDRLDKYNYEITMQQQEFIKYLEDEIKACKAVSNLLFNSNKEIKVYKEILTKYKEIIGDDK